MPIPMRAETLSNLSFLAMDGGAKCPYFTLPQVSQGCRDFSSSAPPLSRETSPTASSTLTKGSISKYLCGDCDGQFLHRQSLLRHRKSVHNKAHRFCWYCNFKWTRPYEYKNHLKKRHPSADIVKVLGKRPGSRRTSLIMARDLAPHISPPAVEPNHQSQAERPQRSVTPPLPAAHVPAPALSGAAHDSRPEYADSTVTSRNYWVVQLTNDVFEDRKNWWLSANPEAFAAADRPSSLLTLPSSAHTPPDYDSMLSADVIVDQDQDFLSVGCHDNGTGSDWGEF